jgi:hypothetical protein
MAVLILSSTIDPHAKAVSEHLDRMGTPNRIWHFSQFITDTSFCFSTDQRALNHLRFDGGEKAMDLADVQSIWFRRPGGIKSAPMPEPWVETMVENECRHALGGILRSLHCLFVNHPDNDSASLYKLSQLRAAGKVGLTTPETLVTNEPDQAREFYERFDGKVIYKLIGESTNFAFPSFEFPAGIPTLPMRGSDVAYLEQVKLAPHLFQQRIEKSFEVRATVIGEEIFAARIDSQAGTSKLDWRMDYGVPMETFALPGAVGKSCLSMMRHFGLNYAAFDFCVDHEGRYFFLELNCAGQYKWLEERTGMPISEQLAKLLAGKAQPLVPPTPVLAT